MTDAAVVIRPRWRGVVHGAAGAVVPHRVHPLAVATPWREGDHATILLAIAATYTAVTALGVHGHRRGQLLIGIWVATTIGVAIQMLWLDAPRALSAAVYAAKKPNPSPEVFGFHDVFHALTGAGAAAHLVAVALLVQSL
ncbi:MAG: hemolysin III family protein [Actinobacteria bacterium]|nr:hemolysin III family protein [Actinomycetota bacterium]